MEITKNIFPKSEYIINSILNLEKYLIFRGNNNYESYLYKKEYQNKKECLNKEEEFQSKKE